MQPIDPSPIFDGQKFPVPAEWFSGRLVVDRGERLTYEHMGWGGYSAEQLRLYVESGHVVARRRFDQVKVLRRRYAKDFEEYESFRKHLAANPDYALRTLGGFTEAGIKALGLTVFEGETFWPPDFTEDEYAEWAGEMVQHCQRPGRP